MARTQQVQSSNCKATASKQGNYPAHLFFMKQKKKIHAGRSRHFQFFGKKKTKAKQNKRKQKQKHNCALIFSTKIALYMDATKISNFTFRAVKIISYEQAYLVDRD